MLGRDKMKKTEQKAIIAVFDSLTKLIFPNADSETVIQNNSIIVTVKKKKH